MSRNQLVAVALCSFTSCTALAGTTTPAAWCVAPPVVKQGPMWPVAAEMQAPTMNEQTAYLSALRARLTGAPECFPDELPQEEKDAIIAGTGALPPGLPDGADLERFFTSSTVWTGDGLQGPSGQAAQARFTYSFPEDGTLWGVAARPVVPNDFGSGLAHVFGGANPDLGREYIRQALAGWRRTSSLTYTEVADNNSQHDQDVTRVATRGDVRIGSGFAWPDSYLAYNFFPGSGSDMFNNSRYWEGNFFARPDDSYRYLRNVIGHEHGHGLGFIHVVPCNQVFLMEPFISTMFDQQGIDEQRNAHRNYGDRFVGNNGSATATALGAFSPATPRAIIERQLSLNGVDGPNNTDEDWFSFSVPAGGNLVGLNITAAPTGGSYVNGQQFSGCSGDSTTVFADQAGNVGIELLNSSGVTVIASATGAGVGAAELLAAPSLAPGTYFIRVFDQGPNDVNNQFLQTYDLTLRRGTASAPPRAIAGLNKRIMAGMTCQFMGDINSFATETGASITSYDWDLDGNGSFEVLNVARPTTVYATPGVRNVTLRANDSNGQSDTDTITVDVFAAGTSVTAVSPYPMRNAQDSAVSITIFGTGLTGVTSAAQVSVSGIGTSIVGTPTVVAGGTQITGLSVLVAPDAPPGARVVTVNAPGGSGRATFYLYPLSPTPFNITSPTNGQTTASAAPLVTWTPSTWARQYFVQVASDDQFTTIVLNSPNSLTTTSWQAPFGVLSPDTEYYVRVRSRNEAGPDVFTSVVSFTTGTASGNNDSCSDAIPVVSGVTAVSTGNASTDGPNDSACESGGSFLLNDVWYSYTASCTGDLTVSLCTTTYDSMLALYSGQCPIGPNEQLGCDDDFCAPGSSVTIPVVGGQDYVIRLGGWNGSRGYGLLNVSCVPSCPGDADGDGLVGLSDIAVMIQNWSDPGEPPVVPFTMGDLTGDGFVGIADLAQAIKNWGTSCE